MRFGYLSIYAQMHPSAPMLMYPAEQEIWILVWDFN